MTFQGIECVAECFGAHEVLPKAAKVHSDLFDPNRSFSNSVGAFQGAPGCFRNLSSCSGCWRIAAALRGAGLAAGGAPVRGVAQVLEEQVPAVRARAQEQPRERKR